MEELQPQDIENLLQELEEEYSAEEVLAPEVETKVRVCPECGKHNLRPERWDTVGRSRRLKGHTVS